MLNPAKRVLLPDLKAGCSLAESCPADKLARYQEMLRINDRRFQTVTYINSTAAVKALYATGFFRDVRLEAVRRRSGRT